MKVSKKVARKGKEGRCSKGQDGNRVSKERGRIGRADNQLVERKHEHRQIPCTGVVNDNAMQASYTEEAPCPPLGPQSHPGRPVDYLMVAD